MHSGVDWCVCPQSSASQLKRCKWVCSHRRLATVVWVKSLPTLYPLENGPVCLCVCVCVCVYVYVCMPVYLGDLRRFSRNAWFCTKLPDSPAHTVKSPQSEGGFTLAFLTLHETLSAEIHTDRERHYKAACEWILWCRSCFYSTDIEYVWLYLIVQNEVALSERQQFWQQ